MKHLKRFVFVFFLLAGLAFLLTMGDRSSPEDSRWYCDAESTSIREGRTYWISDGDLFSNAKTQSDDIAFSGKYSSKCQPLQSYGMAFHISGVSPQSTFYVGIRRYGNDENACLLITGNRGFYQEISLASSSQRGWDLLEEYFTLPEGAEDDSLVFSAHYKGKSGVAYFDDLTVEKEFDQTPASIPNDFPLLEIDVPSSSWNQILQQRSKALQKGILLEENEKPVEMELSFNQRSIPGEIRLKGDWIDHLSGEKWSFRVKCHDSVGVQGQTEFSLMRPQARDFLREWMFKKALQQEGILTPTYQFVHLVLKGKDLGLYVLEGLPNSYLLEHQERRDGPILKWDESGFWEAQTRSYASSGAPPFKGRWNVPKLVDRKKWMENSEGGVAVKALLDWEQFAEVRQVEIWAKYYALVELFQAYHGIIWHNQRFYLNPVTHNLEPIAIDGFTQDGIYKIDERPLMAWGLQPNSNWGKDGLQPFGLFRNKAFLKSYFFYLEKFAQSDFLKRLWSKHGAEMQRITSALQGIRKHYHYPMAASIRRANEIQNYLKPLPAQVWTYRENGKLVVENRWGLPLEIFDEKKPQRFTFLPAFDSSRVPPRIFLPLNSKNLRYRSIGGTSFEKVGKPLPAPQISTVKKVSLCIPKGFKMKGNRITAVSGNWSSNCIIPSGYVLEIPRGVHLSMRPEQVFWLEGQLQETGNGSEEILVSGGAVYFHLQNKKLNFRHWRFRDQKQFSWGNLHEMGGVNVVGAELNWSEVVFEDIHAEDALNLVHCSGQLENVVVQNVSGDGIDFDFCQISVSRSQFIKTGNDGIDFSGGNATVSHCSFSQNGDKSISCGEGNRFLGKNLQMKNQRLGLGVKDLSVAKVENMQCENVQLAAKVFRKKSDWGGGQLVLKNIHGTFSKLYEKDQFSAVSLFP